MRQRSTEVRTAATGTPVPDCILPCLSVCTRRYRYGEIRTPHSARTVLHSPCSRSILPAHRFRRMLFAIALACRHVSLAGRKGAAALASLPPASRAHLPPLPLHPASDIYVRKIQWTMKVRWSKAHRTAKSNANTCGLRPFRAFSACPSATLCWILNIRCVHASSPQRARQPAAEDEPAEDGEERAAPLGPGPGAAPGAQQAATAAPAVPSSRSNTQEATDGNSSRSSSSSSSGGAGEQSQGSGGSGGGECPHIGLSLRSNFVDAQNLWDAAMADSIAQALQRHPRGGALVVHVCGGWGWGPRGWGKADEGLTRIWD